MILERNFGCDDCKPQIDKNYLEANGFVGTKNYNYVLFCEKLYITLYSERDGFDNTALLLSELFNRYKIDGTEVAIRNGFGIFEVLLKDPMFSHVVGCERIDTSYSFRYYARFNKSFEHLRRKIIPKKRVYGQNKRI